MSRDDAVDESFRNRMVANHGDLRGKPLWNRGTGVAEGSISHDTQMLCWRYGHVREPFPETGHIEPRVMQEQRITVNRVGYVENEFDPLSGLQCPQKHIRKWLRADLSGAID